MGRLIDRLNALDERLGLVKPGTRSIDELPVEVRSEIYRRHWTRSGVLALLLVGVSAAALLSGVLDATDAWIVVLPVLFAFNVLISRWMARDVRAAWDAEDAARTDELPG